VLLISGDLRALLSSNLQKICREIDTVTVVGSVHPMRLFTIDIQTEDMEVTDDPLANVSIKEKKAIRDEMRKRLHEKLYKGEITTWVEFNNDRDFLELRKNVDAKFEFQFAKAYRQYIDGDWKAAGAALKKLVEWRPKDGPSVNLDKIVNQRQKGVKPEGWPGYRELTSK